MSATAIVPVPVGYTARRAAVFAPVAGLSPLVRVAMALGNGCEVVVAAAEQLAQGAREALAAHGLSAVRVVEAASPGDRAQCVAAGLRALGDGDHVVVHDVEWPIVGVDIQKRIMAALNEGAAAVMPVRPVTDSVKAIDADGVVTATEERSLLRTVQYPRGFRADVLAMLLRHSNSGSFDELDAALSAATPLTLIEGDDESLCVELPRDADYLAAVIAGRSEDAVRQQHRANR